MRPERPPEGWLLKAWDGDVLVDLIFRPAGGPGRRRLLRARDERSRSRRCPLLVASIDDVLATKLLAMSEQNPDFRPVLEIARSLREQIDWDFVRAAGRRRTVRRGVPDARRAAPDPPGLRRAAERREVRRASERGTTDEPTDEER